MITLEDLRIDYDIKQKPSRRTLRGQIAAWDGKLGPEKAVNVSRPMLNGVVQEWQREGRAPATINKFVATLRRAFRLGKQPRNLFYGERSDRAGHARESARATKRSTETEGALEKPAQERVERPGGSREHRPHLPADL